MINILFFIVIIRFKKKVTVLKWKNSKTFPNRVICIEKHSNIKLQKYFCSLWNVYIRLYNPIHGEDSMRWFSNESKMPKRKHPDYSLLTTCFLNFCVKCSSCYILVTYWNKVNKIVYIILKNDNVHAQKP